MQPGQSSIDTIPRVSLTMPLWSLGEHLAMHKENRSFAQIHRKQEALVNERTECLRFADPSYSDLAGKHSLFPVKGKSPHSLAHVPKEFSSPGLERGVDLATISRSLGPHKLRRRRRPQSPAWRLTMTPCPSKRATPGAGKTRCLRHVRVTRTCSQAGGEGLIHRRLRQRSQASIP